MIVNKTLKVLNEIDLLVEDKLYEAVDKIYINGFGDKQKEFEDSKTSFRKMIDRIVPFNNSNAKESDFYDLFNSIEAVPEKYRQKYLDCIRNKKLFDAMQYCLQLTNGQFQKLLKEGRVDFEIKTFIDAKYDPELGLLINEHEANQNII